MNWRVAPLLLLLIPGAAGDADITDKSEKSVRKGVAWILRAQNRDGSWGLDAAGSPDISCTVVAALALMSAGNTERGGPDPEAVAAVRLAIDFILRKAEKMHGDIGGGEVTLVQNKLGHRVHTFFATVFLTQVFGSRGPWVRESEISQLHDWIGQMADWIAKSQEPDGSWHKEFFGSLKATCMAWLALRSASTAGFDVNGAAVEKTIKFIKEQYNPSTKLFDRGTGQGSYQTIYATASCLRVLYAMGEGESQEASGAADAFMKFVKGGQMGAAFLTVEGEDFMSAALVTQALLIEDGKRWKEWFPWIRDELVKRQNGDGSWTSTACISGRTFATACALMTLQAPYRLLPIQEQ